MLEHTCACNSNVDVCRPCWSTCVCHSNNVKASYWSVFACNSVCTCIVMVAHQYVQMCSCPKVTHVYMWVLLWRWPRAYASQSSGLLLPLLSQWAAGESNWHRCAPSTHPPTPTWGKNRPTLFPKMPHQVQILGYNSDAVTSDGENQSQLRGPYDLVPSNGPWFRWVNVSWTLFQD